MTSQLDSNVRNLMSRQFRRNGGFSPPPSHCALHPKRCRGRCQSLTFQLSIVSHSSLDLSFVFPCLNEEATLGPCIERTRKTLDAAGLNYEIVVADNGSTDRSPEIARSLGARVVPVPVRGYGAALKAGILAAEAPYVMFADSDGTYLYEDAPALLHAAREADADMAIASRIRGKIEPGAMPFLHRWLGTPVLTTLINLLFHGRLSDCNSGFRCLKKSSYLTWDIRADGMEFASELLIKALKGKAKSVEIPSGLRPSPVPRQAHLRTWRDGMRHLLFILAEKPKLFEYIGLFLLVLSSSLQAASAVTGPVGVSGVHFFDVHSQALLLLGAVLGVQSYGFSCMLFLQSRDKPLAITRKLIDLNEGVLFFALLMLLAGIGLITVRIFFLWISANFSGLHFANELLVWVHFLCVGLVGTMGLLGLHVLKKSRK